MRDNDGFMTGMWTGLALGALVVMAMSPGMRRPMMQGANRVGERMQKMWRRGDRMMEDMMPEELT